MFDLLIINPAVNTLLVIYNVFFQNFGIAIILFTLLIRLITHPLTVQQVRGSARMQDLQKNERWIEMQEKYKGNREALAQEQMKLYKELGINPFGQCLPLLIQLPIIIGLYQAITSALATTPMDMVELTGRVYSFLPNPSVYLPLNNQFLWMNLSQPERLYIPFIPIGIPVLAILVAVTTYLQSRLMTPPSSNPNDQAARMSSMMNLYMPFFMGYLAFSFASGLALYFVVSNLFTIGQYALIGKVNWSNLLTPPWSRPGEKAAPASQSRPKPAAVRAVSADGVEDEGERKVPFSSLSPQEKAEIRRKKRRKKK